MLTHNGTKTIETERLILRRFEYTDDTAMLKYWIADEKIQSMYSEPVYSTKEEVKELLDIYIGSYEKDDYYRWAIIEKDCGECIGQIAYWLVDSKNHFAEIEYCIGKSFWGKGYAGEALQAVIDFTFSHTDFVKLEAYHRAENIKSGRVLEKSAMYITDNVERFRRENVLPHGEVCYCIEREIYEKLCSRKLRELP